LKKRPPEFELENQSRIGDLFLFCPIHFRFGDKVSFFPPGFRRSHRNAWLFFLCPMASPFPLHAFPLAKEDDFSFFFFIGLKAYLGCAFRVPFVMVSLRNSTGGAAVSFSPLESSSRSAYTAGRLAVIGIFSPLCGVPLCSCPFFF